MNMKFGSQRWPLKAEIGKNGFQIKIPLKIKFTFYIGVMALLWMAGLAALCIWQSLENTQSLMHARLAQFASLKAQQIERVINNQASDLNTALQSDSIGSTLESLYYGNVTTDEWATKMEKTVRNMFFTSFRFYQLVYFYDNSGNLIFSMSNPDLDKQTVSALEPGLPLLLPLGMMTAGKNQTHVPSNKSATTNEAAAAAEAASWSNASTSAVANVGASLTASRSFSASGVSSKINFTKNPDGIWSWLSRPAPLVDPGNNVTKYSYSITVPLNHLTVVETVQTSKLLGYCSAVIDSSWFVNQNSGWGYYEYPLSKEMRHPWFAIMEASSKNGWRYLFPTGDNSTISRSWHSFSEFPALQADLNLMNHAPKSNERQNPGGAIMKTSAPEMSKASVGFSYAKALNQNWLVTIALPQSQAESGYRTQTKALVGVAIGILIFVVLYAFCLTSLITHPMHHIYTGMELKSGKIPDEPSTHEDFHYNHYHHREMHDNGSTTSDNDVLSKPNKHLNSGLKTAKNAAYPHYSSSLDAHPMVNVLHRTLSHGSATTVYTSNSTLEDQNGFQVPEPLEPLNRWWIRDEFDELIAEYNAMIHRLNSQYFKMEDEVRLRTREARESQRLAETASAAKSLFMMNISHELLTPLNGIMGITAVTLEESHLPQIQASLRTIITSGNILQELLQELLNYAAHLAGVEEDYKEFTLGSLAESMEQTFSSRAEAKNIDFNVVFRPSRLSECVIGTDLDRLKHICTSLVSNAIKFSDPEKIASTSQSDEPRVQLPQSRVLVQMYLRAVDSSMELTTKLKGHASMLEIIINDSGVGISQDRLEHIFEAFVQGDDALRKRFTGTGLGLAMSKMMCEKLGGYISVYSLLNMGTMVVLRLPVANVNRFKTSSGSNLHQSGTNNNCRVWYTDSKSVGKVSCALMPSIVPSMPSSMSCSTLNFPSNSLHDLQMSLQVSSRAPSCTSRVDLSQMELSRHDLTQLSLCKIRDSGKSCEELKASEELKLPDEVKTSEETRKSEQLKYANQLASSSQLFSKEAASAPFKGSSSSVKYSELCVLVADDNEIMRVLVHKFLLNLGVKKVDIAVDGKSVILMIENAIVNGTKYSMIFMDLEMPGYDGVEATTNMRKQLGYYCPVVALTGHSDDKTVQECLKAGLQKVLVKPVSQQTLAETIEELYDE